MTFILNSDNDSFTCCLPLKSESCKVLLGTNNGSIFLGTIMDIEAIKSIKFDGNHLSNVLLDVELKYEVNGLIRQIDYLNEDTIVFITDQGEICTFNLPFSDLIFIQKFKGTQYERPWRMLILNDKSFITIGNYRRIDLWKYENGDFQYEGINYGGYSLFCVDYINNEGDKFLINGNDGWTGYYQKRNLGIRQYGEEINVTSKNLQKIYYAEDYGCIFSIDYWGSIHIFQLSDKSILEKLEEFNLTSSRGNWVCRSQETNEVLIGTNNELFTFSKELEIKKLHIQAKQIFGMDKIDFILTSKTIVRPNYNATKQVEDISKFKYIKIALVGGSRVGKTCFCKRLKSDTFEETTSSFGKRVWSIDVDGNTSRKMLYYDLAGQETELFTYFPMIDDSDIILIFYNGENTGTFMDAINYYNELKKGCPKAKFHFIQTFSNRDPDRLVKKRQIEKEFNKLEDITFEDNLIKIDSETGIGYNEFFNKVINNIDWIDRARTITQSQTYDRIEIELNNLYDNQVKNISISELSKKVGLKKGRVRNVIIQFSRQGKVSFIEEDEMVIINDESYEKCFSLVAELIVTEDGFCKTKVIKDDLIKDPISAKYIRNILKYYRTTNIGIVFKELDPEYELFIIPQKLEETLPFSDFKIPKQKIELIYRDFEFQLIHFCEFLEKYDMQIVGLSKTQLLACDYFDKSNLYIEFNKSAHIDDSSLKRIIIYFEVTNSDEFRFKEDFFKHLIEKIGDKYCDYMYTDALTDNRKTVDEILQYFLKNPFEKQFCDFKRELSLSDNERKAELLKDISGLTNSSYVNSNRAYLIIGLEEIEFKKWKIHVVQNFSLIEQQISQLVDEFLYQTPDINIHQIPITNVLNWQQRNLISSNIEFALDKSNYNDGTKILLIELKRSPHTVTELSKSITFTKNGRQKTYEAGRSWFRICSHTYILREYHRVRQRAL